MSIKSKLNYETVELTKIKKAVQLCLSREMIEDIKTDVTFGPLLDYYYINCLKEMLALKAGDRVIRYPKNWKEAFKERWTPRWLKKRFPVKYREYDVLVVFPDLLKEFPVPMQLRNKNYYMTFTELGSILPGEINEN